MKRYFLISLSALIFFSCNSTNTETDQADIPDTSFIKKENIITRNSKPSTSLNFIKNWDGKTAREAGMFEDSTLVNRLSILLGNEYQYFQENWNVQTPIEKEKGIYTASGCKQHDCPTYYSIVYFDIENNNINVLIKRGLLYKLFTEKGEIPLPSQMKKNQNIIRANA
ncbi:MAG: hypothetical protein ABIN48_11815 [Ginsengibacter sp.]